MYLLLYQVFIHCAHAYIVIKSIPCIQFILYSNTPCTSYTLYLATVVLAPILIVIAYASTCLFKYISYIQLAFPLSSMYVSKLRIHSYAPRSLAFIIFDRDVSF